MTNSELAVTTHSAELAIKRHAQSIVPDDPINPCVKGYVVFTLARTLMKNGRWPFFFSVLENSMGKEKNNHSTYEESTEEDGSGVLWQSTFAKQPYEKGRSKPVMFTGFFFLPDRCNELLDIRLKS